MGKIRFSISVEKEVYQQLKQDAEKANRSMSGQAATILEQHYKGEAKNPAAKQ